MISNFEKLALRALNDEKCLVKAIATPEEAANHLWEGRTYLKRFWRDSLAS